LQFNTNSFGSLGGADVLCQNAATNASLAGTFKAWMSDSTTSAASRLTHATVPYVLVDGTRIADDWTDLTDGTIQHGINKNEYGGGHSTGVFTGTGTSGAISGGNCSNWTVSSGNSTAESGNTDSTNGNWTAGTGERCRYLDGIYCFEQ